MEPPAAAQRGMDNVRIIMTQRHNPMISFAVRMLLSLLQYHSLKGEKSLETINLERGIRVSGQ